MQSYLNFLEMIENFLKYYREPMSSIFPKSTVVIPENGITMIGQTQMMDLYETTLPEGSDVVENFFNNVVRTNENYQLGYMKKIFSNQTDCLPAIERIEIILSNLSGTGKYHLMELREKMTPTFKYLRNQNPICIGIGAWVDLTIVPEFNLVDHNDEWWEVTLKNHDLIQYGIIQSDFGKWAVITPRDPGKTYIKKIPA